MSTADWARRGKTVAELIRELQTFEDQSLEVRLSVDDGATSVPLSLVGKLAGGYAGLLNCETLPSIVRHADDED